MRGWNCYKFGHIRQRKRPGENRWSVSNGERGGLTLEGDFKKIGRTSRSPTFGGGRDRGKLEDEDDILTIDGVYHDS